MFISKEEASEYLHRSKRYNSHVIEELREGNWERECVEEICGYEEVREVFENDAQTVSSIKK